MIANVFVVTVAMSLASENIQTLPYGDQLLEFDISTTCALGIAVAIEDYKKSVIVKDFNSYMVKSHEFVRCQERKDKMRVLLNPPGPTYKGGAFYYTISKKDFSIIERREMR